MKANSSKPRYALGIDLGVQSLGWALIEFDGKDYPIGILRAGVRCFEAGVEGDVERGKDQSRAAARRGPRLARRQIWRRARRRRKLLRILQLNGLFPDRPIQTPQQIHELVETVDAGLRRKYLSSNDAVAPHTLFYRLRAKALDDKLDLHEFGRAIYHLAQRRGFLSNRKSAGKGEDEGVVKSAISELGEKINASGARTLGEYFARVDPTEQRIRQRWTSRAMYEAEFEAVWSAQAAGHDELTNVLKAQIHNAIFHQRPLKSQSHLIGKCELIPGRRRAPLACRIAQRFRLLAALNNLEIIIPGELNRPLDAGQRASVLAALQEDGDQKFTQLRKLLKIKNKFNLEEGGESKIPGNRTDSKLAAIFGQKWAAISDQQRDQLVDDLLSLEDEPSVVRLAKRKWGLNDEQAALLSQVRLEQDRARSCRVALHRLVAHMEKGLHYATARKLEFPESLRAGRVFETLPPVLKALPDLRNPAVCRALTELRKVVNAIVGRYGKPQTIRIELARDLKNPRQKRKETWEKNRANQKRREEAAKGILSKIPGLGEPRQSDIEKWLLAEECCWTCPFTGKGISPSSLLGKNPQFDVEHIWPRSRTLDNTYPNKTLCFVDENRHKKRNMTPFEAYGRGPQWNDIINRVKQFKGDMARVKLGRFLCEMLQDDFTENQLQDTRYASRLAGEYLSLLYGGRSDDDGTLRIQVNTGGATAILRNEWMLNSILSDGGKKERTNHKHHAVDALAIALSSPAIVKRFADAAGTAWEHKRRLFAPVAPPWPTFLDDARQSIESIFVSHRVNHRLNGALHEETNYSKPQNGKVFKGKPMESRHVRKPVTALSASELECIADDMVKVCVKKKLEEVGNDVKKLEGNWPSLPTKAGAAIPIRRVRIKKNVSVRPLGSANAPRFVASGSNHHTVIVERMDKRNHPKWEDHAVTLLDALQRKTRNQEVIQRCWEGAQFRFAISAGDSILMFDEAGVEHLYLVMSISEGDNEFRVHDDARTADEIKKAKARMRAGGDKLRRQNARKVVVSPIGEIAAVLHD